MNDVKEFKSLREKNLWLKKLLAERDLEVDVMKEINARSGEPESASSDEDPRERTRRQPTSRLLIAPDPALEARYRSRRKQLDRHLVRALHLRGRRHPAPGYRLVGAALSLRGWRVNDKRAYRRWREHGLALPPCRPSSCKIRTGNSLEHAVQKRNDVWAYELMHDSYGGGHEFRCLTVKDEASTD